MNTVVDSQIEAFAATITEEEIRAVMVGVKVDLSKVKDPRAFKAAAIHCCLNGPVGVNKSTTFPGVEGEVKIKDLYDGRFSNKMWKTFCAVIGERLSRVHPELVIGCQQAGLYGTVWPQNEATRL